MATFTPFPVPVSSDDTPLVQHAGSDYVCTGCGGHVPSGAWIYEVVADGMVIGLRMKLGTDGPDVHRCGRTEP